MKGDTVSNVTKPATLETGAVVQVPLFVNVGDRAEGRSARGALHLARLAATQPRGRLRACRRSPTRRFACSDRSRWPDGCRPPSSSGSRRSSTGRLRVPRGLGRRRASTPRSSAASRARGSGSARSRRASRRRSGSRSAAASSSARGRSTPTSSRRFVASAAENGIDVFRLHDPLNDVSNLREAAEAIVAAERDFEAGLVYSPGRTGEIETLIERAKMLPELGAVARPAPRPDRLAAAAHRRGARARAAPRRAGCPSGSTRREPAAARSPSSLAAARAGAQLIACAIYPLALTLHRVSGEALAEALAAPGSSPASTCDALWEATDLLDEHIGDELVTAARAAHRRAGGAPRPAGQRRRRDRPSLRAEDARDRLDEVLEELDRIRAETGWPPLASPIGQMLASQALLNVLSASRYLIVLDELRAPRRRRVRHAAGADRPRARARRPAHRATPRARRTSRRRSTRCASGRTASRRARRSCSCSASSARTPRSCCAGSAAADAGTTTSPASGRSAPSESRRSSRSSRSRGSAR